MKTSYKNIKVSKSSPQKLRNATTKLLVKPHVFMHYNMVSNERIAILLFL